MKKNENGQGKLPQNVLYFARALRAAGMRVGPNAILEANKALEIARIGDRDDFYWTLHCIFVSRREDHALFDQTFKLFWRPRKWTEKIIELLSPAAPEREKNKKPKPAQNRAAQSLIAQNQNEKKQKTVIEVDASLSMSVKENLRKKDFERMTNEEFLLARSAIARLRLPINQIKTRRFRPSAKGKKFDPRAMMKKTAQTGGEIMIPKFKKQKTKHPPIVVIADISGSMSRYSRMILHFAHALSRHRRNTHVFLFGTRLTNITRALRHRDPDEAMDEVCEKTPDWEGGTRIAQTLTSFNRFWSRRVLGQGAITLLITDGLERATQEQEIEKLIFETERLRRSCRRLIWLNPLLRFDQFEAKAAGVKAMLPHVDDFRPVHSIDSLTQLCHALQGDTSAVAPPLGH